MALLGELTLAFCCCSAAASDALSLDQDPQQLSLELEVNRAIERGTLWLREHQNGDEGWAGQEAEHEGGMTALVTYTLLKSGVDPSTQDLQDAFVALDTVEPSSTYARAVFLLMAEASRDFPRWRSKAEKAARGLIQDQKDGVWAYPWGHPDLSNVQFALLGLRAAQAMGVEVPEETLTSCAEAFFAYQSPDGGFSYHEHGPPTGGMTAASLASLSILDEFAEEHRALKKTLAKHKKDRAKAETWLDKQLRMDANPMRGERYTLAWHYPYLWAVERYGTITSTKKIGKLDWYREGARWLVDHQLPDGNWPHTGFDDTCFAILFLRRATFSLGHDVGQDEAWSYEELRLRQPVRPEPGTPLRVEWLVAGPYPAEQDEDPISLDPFRFRSLKLREGAKSGEHRWKLVRFDEQQDWADLDELKPGDRCLWALGTHLTVHEDAARQTRLWITAEDGWRVLINGKEVERALKVASPIREESSVLLELEPGTHSLLILIEDLSGAAPFAARWTREDGQRLRTDHFLMRTDPED